MWKRNQEEDFKLLSIYQTGLVKVQLKTWGPNKKTKECTIQVDKIKGEDVKFVKLFAETSVMHVLEEAFKGHNIKPLSKSTNLSTRGGYTNEL